MEETTKTNEKKDAKIKELQDFLDAQTRIQEERATDFENFKVDAKL